MNKLFLLENDNRIKKTTILTVSEDCEYLIELMKEEYKKQNTYDRKNKIKHQFSQSHFKKEPFNCIIFYPNQNKITWHITNNQLMGISNCNKEDFLTTAVSETLNKYDTTYKTSPTIIYMSDEVQIKW